MYDDVPESSEVKEKITSDQHISHHSSKPLDTYSDVEYVVAESHMYDVPESSEVKEKILSHQRISHYSSKPLTGHIQWCWSMWLQNVMTN